MILMFVSFRFVNYSSIITRVMAFVWWANLESETFPVRTYPSSGAEGVSGVTFGLDSLFVRMFGAALIGVQIRAQPGFWRFGSRPPMSLGVSHVFWVIRTAVIFGGIIGVWVNEWGFWWWGGVWDASHISKIDISNLGVLQCDCCGLSALRLMFVYGPLESSRKGSGSHCLQGTLMSFGPGPAPWVV